MVRPGEDFARVLSCACPGAAVYDYGRSADFAKLWDADESGHPVALHEMNGRDAIIVVWDGQEPEDKQSPAALLQHLTPLDWALAFSTKALQLVTQETARFGISIVDVSGRAHESWAMQMRHQMLAEMPWIALYSPLLPQKGGVPAEVRLGYRPIIAYRPDVKDPLLVQENGAWRPSDRSHEIHLAVGLGRRSLDQLHRLARQWSATLVEEHGHHDLNNIVGPQLLTKRPPQSDAPLSRAFHRRLDWTRSLPAIQLAGIRLPHAVPFHILAIDDEMNTGWSNVIAAMLGLETDVQDTSAEIAPIAGQGNVTLFGTTDPNALLHQLTVKDAMQAADRYGHRQFDSPMRSPANAQPVAWMMILDLYLFSRDRKAQRAWFETLLGIARQLTGLELAWPGISKDEINVVKKWLSGAMEVNGPNFDTAVSLLPRLCALRWPSVPLLVFSSSRRRSLVSKLAKYRNIFLAAPKPNLLTGNAAEEVEAFAEGFQREIYRCLALVEIQRKLIRLDHAGRQPDAAAPTVANINHRHLTIAFDEAGRFVKKNSAAIGGVIVEVHGKDQESAQKETAAFFETLRRQGVNFYDHPPAYEEINGIGSLLECACVPKKSDISRSVRRAKDAHPLCSILMFRVLVPKSRNVRAGATFRDAVYLHWLDATLELVLSEYLESIDPEGQSSLSIWLPTRAVPCDSRKDALAQARKFDVRPLDNVVVSVGGASVGYVLVAKALSGRDYNGLFNRTIALKVRKIPYFFGRSRSESAVHWYCQDCERVLGMTRPDEPRLDASTWRQIVRAKPNLWCKERGHENKYLLADYTVAAHLADAALSEEQQLFPKPELGAGNVDLDRSIDVTAGDRLLDFLQAGRLARDEKPFEALRLAYKNDFFLGGLNRSNLGARVEQRLVRELAELARKAPGESFIALAVSADIPVPVTLQL